MLTGCTLFLIETDPAVSEAFEALSSAFNFTLHRFDTLDAALAGSEPDAAHCIVVDCDNPSDIDRVLLWREGGDRLARVLLLSGLPAPLLKIFRAGHPGLEILEKPVEADDLIARLKAMKDEDFAEPATA